MEDNHFNTLVQNTETQISDPSSTVTVFDWDKPFNQENEESTMDEDDEDSSSDRVVCDLSGRLFLQGNTRCQWTVGVRGLISERERCIYIL